VQGEGEDVGGSAQQMWEDQRNNSCRSSKPAADL
jgi:hypothetical protein